MPALVLFGQKTLVAGDALRLPSLLAILFRLLQIVVTAPLLIRLPQVDWDQERTGLTADSPCSESSSSTTSSGGMSWMGTSDRAVFYSYLAVTILMAILAIVLDGCIFHVSSQGSPVQTEKRSQLPFLCFLKWIPLSLLRTTCLVLGILTVKTLQTICHCLITSTDSDVHQSVLNTDKCPGYTTTFVLMSILMSTHIADGIVSTLVYVYFLSGWSRRLWQNQKVLCCRRFLLGHYMCGGSKKNSTATVHQHGWACCCRLLCTCTSLCTCCLLGGGQAIVADFADVSTALEELMSHDTDVDVTLSDVLAGIVVLRLVQTHARNLSLRQSLPQRDASRTGNSRTGDDVRLLQMEEGGENSGYHCANRPPSADQNENLRKKNQPRRRRRSRVVQLKHRDSSELGGDELRAEKQYFVETQREYLMPDRPEDAALLRDAVRFMKMANAVYGHLMFMYHRPLTGPCCLALDSSLAPCPRTCGRGVERKEARIHGDNLCRCNENAMHRVLDFDPEDHELVYASFRVGVRATPYAVLLDHVTKTIVVVIRGSLSLEDAVADVTIRPRLLSVEYGFEEAYCHSGVLACAEWIQEDLRRSLILSRLLDETSKKLGCYTLCFTGHSLGAGCAAILSMMYKGKYPSTRCFAFEPPGAVLSANVAEQDHIVSFVLDADVVPRLSYDAIRHLRDDVLEMVSRIKVPKHQIMMTSISSSKVDELFSCPETSIVHSREDVPPSRLANQIAHLKSSESGRVPSGYVDVNLCLPGRIVQLVQTQSGDNEKDEQTAPNYVAVWAKREDLKEIQVTTSLLSDHDPGKVSIELELFHEWFQGQPPSTGAYSKASAVTLLRGQLEIKDDSPS